MRRIVVRIRSKWSRSVFAEFSFKWDFFRFEDVCDFVRDHIYSSSLFDECFCEVFETGKDGE